MPLPSVTAVLFSPEPHWPLVATVKQLTSGNHFIFVGAIGFVKAVSAHFHAVTTSFLQKYSEPSIIR